MTTQVRSNIVAIDVAKDKLDIYDGKTGKVDVIKNETRSIGAWLANLKKHGDVEKIVLEPTGGYEDNLLLQINRKSLKAFYVHPSKLVAFKKAMGIKAKTDCIDAVCLF